MFARQLFAYYSTEVLLLARYRELKLRLLESPSPGAGDSTAGSLWSGQQLAISPLSIDIPNRKVDLTTISDGLIARISLSVTYSGDPALAHCMPGGDDPGTRPRGDTYIVDGGYAIVAIWDHQPGYTHEQVTQILRDWEHEVSSRVTIINAHVAVYNEALPERVELVRQQYQEGHVDVISRRVLYVEKEKEREKSRNTESAKRAKVSVTVPPADPAESDSEWDWQNDVYLAIQEERERHAAVKERPPIEALGASLYDIMLPNWHTVRGAVTIPDNDEPANVGVLYERFAAVLRGMSNYLASAMSVRDFVRQIPSTSTPPLKDEWDRRRANTVITHPELEFMALLRNHMLHVGHPGLAFKGELTYDPISNAEYVRNITLLRVGTLRTSLVFTRAMEDYAHVDNEYLNLGLLLEVHFFTMFELNKWLYDTLRDTNRVLFETEVREIEDRMEDAKMSSDHPGIIRFRKSGKPGGAAYQTR
jgi:hypothetical protein